MATEQELSGFLKSVKRRAFKRAAYQVRDEEAALDIVQESMMRLAQHYGDRPLAEMPHLFQRILSHAIIDSLRRRKTRWNLFSNLSDLTVGQSDEVDPLEALEDLIGHEGTQSAQDALEKTQTLKELEFLLMQLPERQREAFLLRYWEEMDLAETAAVMGCSQGSVKTHCFRAVQALSKALKARGYGS